MSINPMFHDPSTTVGVSAVVGGESLNAEADVGPLCPAAENFTTAAMTSALEIKDRRF